MKADDESFRDAVLIRLFRLWALAREDGHVGLGPIHSLASQLQLASPRTPTANLRVVS